MEQLELFPLTAAEMRAKNAAKIEKMKAVREDKVKAAVKKLLKNYKGLYQFWPVQHGYGSTTLDVVGCYKKRFFAIETKRPGKKLTPRQELVAASIEKSGGRVFVIGSRVTDDAKWSGMDELEAWLDEGRRQG